MVPQIIELKSQFQLRLFAVERCDLVQGPVEVVHAGSVEEIPTGIAQGIWSCRGETGVWGTQWTERPVGSN